MTTTDASSILSLPLLQTTPTSFDPDDLINDAPSAAAAQPTTGASTRPAVDYSIVRQLREEAAERLAARDGTTDAESDEQRHHLGRSLISDVIGEEIDRAIAAGQTPWSDAQQDALADAVFDALFGLGRLQQHVDNDELDEIHLVGADHVWLEYWDGRKVRAEPVADSDEELIEQIAFLASQNSRAFTTANRSLHLMLPGGQRLAASAWDVPRPIVSIRRHRFVDATLETCVTPPDPTFLPMFDDHMAVFLQAVVDARQSILVGGIMGTAKTTLVRAMARAIDPQEHIATLETERELHLDQAEREGRVLAWEASPGSSEFTSSGDRAGERTIGDFLFDSFRFSVTRTIMGEIRGAVEAIPLLKVAQSGGATISTIHATDADAVIDRFVTLAMEAGNHVTYEYANRQVAYNFDLIIYMKVRRLKNNRKQRYVSDILAVGRDMESGRPSTTNIYTEGPDGTAVPGILPDGLRVKLEAAGLPAGHFRNGGARL